MAKVKLLKETSEEIINEEGTILSSRREIVTVAKKEKFGIIYIQHLWNVLGIKSATHLRVMIAIWTLSEMDTNRVFLVKSIKEEIASKTGYTLGTVQNSITFLVKKEMLIRTDSSVYIINPTYFFRGSEIARSKTIELLIKITTDEK